MEVFPAHLLDHLNHIVFQFAINSLQVESLATLLGPEAAKMYSIVCLWEVLVLRWFLVVITKCANMSSDWGTLFPEFLLGAGDKTYLI